eukprot:TRINITY_DN67858_c14_g1_i1.p1 TRINITY_DN67858_c14_g1~~TRINITY_DN67858_c14_g1_i1.p1  ORF type:complete len:319 (-),score=14.75 TRINITY_DN67858_c14_g1_i1:124-1080(-)
MMGGACFSHDGITPTGMQSVSSFPRITVDVPTDGKLSFKLVSDVHTEFPNWDQDKLQLPNTEPILLLAGDIGAANNTKYADFVFQQAERFQVVLICAGNHEFYGSEYHMALETLQKVAETAPKGNVYFLDCTGVVINGLPFLGCALWSHIPPDNYSAVQASINDYSRIKFTNRKAENAVTTRLHPKDTSTIHNHHRKWLETILPQVPEGAVVMTHHVPTMQFDTYPPSAITAAFRSDMDEMIKSPTVACWVFGHTHRSTEGKVNGALVISNQLGYMHDTLDKTGYDENLVINVQWCEETAGGDGEAARGHWEANAVRA